MSYAIELLDRAGQVVDRQEYVTAFRCMRAEQLLSSQIRGDSRRLFVLAEDPHQGRNVPRGSIVSIRKVVPPAEPITEQFRRPNPAHTPTDTYTRRPTPVDFRARACCESQE
jgi:hypothetical protein